MRRTLLLIRSLLLPNPVLASQQPRPDPAALAKEAWGALSAHRFEEAITIYEGLVRASPDVAGFRMNLGIAHYLAEQYAKSLRELELAVRTDPSLTTAYVYLGASHLETGNHNQAVTALREFVRREPDDPKTLQMLGDALLAVQQFEEAARPFKTLSRVAPNNPEAWYGLVRSYKSLAGGAFEQVHKMAPESAYWFSLMGFARLAQKLYDYAFFFYRKALEKQPGMRGIHTAISEVYEKTDHPEWAAQERKKEEQLGKPDCVAARAECDFLEGRFQDVLASGRKEKTPQAYYWQALSYDQLAEEAFSKFQALPPSFSRHRLRAEIQQQQGSDFEAASEWRKALDLSPGDPTARKGLAQALMKTRDYQATWPVVENLLREDPESAQLHCMAGDILLNLRRPGEAIPFLMTALQKDPGRVQANASLGSAYLSTGETAKAIPHLKLALEADQDGSRHYQLARAYQREGETALASEMLRKHQEIQEAQRDREEQFDRNVQITPP